MDIRESGMFTYVCIWGKLNLVFENRILAPGLVLAGVLSKDIFVKFEPNNIKIKMLQIAVFLS